MKIAEAEMKEKWVKILKGELEFQKKKKREK